MWGSLSAVPRRTSAACLFAPAHPHDPPPPLTDSAGWEWSGRPDLNRGPPAPKAGALPGCATPRQEMRIDYTALANADAAPTGVPVRGIYVLLLKGKKLAVAQSSGVFGIHDDSGSDFLGLR